MKKILLSMSAMALLLSAAMVSSCGKDDDDKETTATKLAHTWTYAYDADDSNGNKVLDESEKYIDSLSMMFNTTFNANGTGSINQIGTGAQLTTFTWLVENTNYLRMVSPSFIDTGYDTTVYRIHTLTDNLLITEDTTNNDYSWTAATR